MATHTAPVDVMRRRDQLGLVNMRKDSYAQALDRQGIRHARATDERYQRDLPALELNRASPAPALPVNGVLS